jgi:hypothetical protein
MKLSRITSHVWVFLLYNTRDVILNNLFGFSVQPPIFIGVTLTILANPFIGRSLPSIGWY